MEPEIYLSPVDMSIFDFTAETDRYRLANVVKFFNHPETDYEEKVEAANLDKFDIALIGIPEDRGSLYNQGAENAPGSIRKYLYSLFSHWTGLQMIDMGNIKKGNSVEDTYYAVKEVVSLLVEKKVVPILLGGSQDLTFANYLAYEKLGKIINITAIDSVYDLGQDNQTLNARSWLSQIILHQPNFLFNFTNIGYQTYFVNRASVQLMKDLFFDVHRLGEVRANLEEAEPMIRNADIVSFDISVIRRTDAPGNFKAGPNGFTGEEACQLTRYAGMSDKLSSIGFYEVNPKYDDHGQTAHLTAQMIWYFIDGFMNRQSDLPHLGTEDYIKFTVTPEEHDEDLVFLKSKKTGRWWMVLEAGNKENTKYRPHQFVPCSYADYQTALNNDIPDRWLKVQQKLM